MCLNMHGLLHMISQKQKKIYPRGEINMRRNLRRICFPHHSWIKKITGVAFSTITKRQHLL